MRQILHSNELFYLAIPIIRKDLQFSNTNIKSFFALLKYLVALVLQSNSVTLIGYLLTINYLLFLSINNLEALT